MPGTIRVSVLEAVDLPAAVEDGTAGRGVTVRVTLGKREYKTEPGNLDAGRTAPWNSDYAFPVTNLRDKLEVAVCNDEDQAVAQTAIAIPSIVERGYRDEFVDFKGGGRIHLKLSFVLTDEERKKIEMMRLATLKRREEERVAALKRREAELLEKTVVFQTLQPTADKDHTGPAVPRVTITEVDESTTDGTENRNKENACSPLGFGPTTIPLKPRPAFDYARAVGVKAGRNIKRKLNRSTVTGTSASLSKIIKTVSIDEHPAKQAGGENFQASLDTTLDTLAGPLKRTSTSTSEAKPLLEDHSLVGKSPLLSPDKSDLLVISPGTHASSPTTPATKGASTPSVAPSMQGPYVGKVTTGTVKARVEALESTLRQGPEENTVSPSELQEEQWQVEGQRARDMLEAEAAAMAVSLEDSSNKEDEHRGKRRGSNGVAVRDQVRKSEMDQGTPRAVNVHSEYAPTEYRTPKAEVKDKSTEEGSSGLRKSPGQPISVLELHQLASSEIREKAMDQLNSQEGFPNKVWQALSAIADEILCTPGQVQSSEIRAGTESRWAQKTNMESRWPSPFASPEKARRLVREDPSGQASDPFRARAKILEFFSAVAGPHDSQDDDQSFQHHSVAGSIGVVLNKVVGGAAMLLAALVMLWPLGECPSDRRNTPGGDDRYFLTKYEDRQGRKVPSKFSDHHFRTNKAGVQVKDLKHMYPGQRIQLP